MARVKKKPSSERRESVMSPGATRPKRFDRRYIAGLAMAYCLMPEVPQEVARAFVDILCAQQVLEEDGSGNIEIAGNPGATGLLPEVAGKALRGAVTRAIERKAGLNILAYLVRGTGSSGSGAPGSTRGHGGPRVDPGSKRPRNPNSADWRRQLEWDKDKVIAALGGSASAQARRIVEWVLKEVLVETAQVSPVDVQLGTSLQAQVSSAARSTHDADLSREPHPRKDTKSAPSRRRVQPPLPEKVADVYSLLCRLPQSEALSSKQIGTRQPRRSSA